MAEILTAALIGLGGGLAAGLLGVSSGGILVPLLIFGLGLNQHTAQGASLVAQILPTGLLGARQYRASGHSVPRNWLVLVAGGFAVGGMLGAGAASFIAGPVLTWSYVAYLLILVGLVALRGRRVDRPSEAQRDVAPAGATLAFTGLVAGLSSGLLGIGGGLAITALGAGLLHLAQHRAQAISVAVSVLPLTLPAALIYAVQGWPIPWPAVAGIVTGLAIGTTIGAKLATGLEPARLRGAFVLLILVMAAAMAGKALALI